MSRILELESLKHTVRPHFWSRPRQTLDGVSLEVEAGEVFGFLGPNGAGKTTTIKMILGLLRPSSGRVTVLGRPPTDPQTRRRIGFMPEQAYFPPQLTGLELVFEHALLSGLPVRRAREAVASALERVSLTDVGRQRLRTYSKGMLQRIGLAQALVGNPDCVILDEPMSGLDPIGRRDVREIMVGLKKAGKTVFFSTHILPDVEMICDRVAIITNGQIRKTGNLTDLIHQHVARVEVTFAGIPEDELEPLLGTCPRQTTGTGEYCTTTDSIESANRIIRDVQQRGGTILSVQTIRRSLEELFVAAATRGREEASAEGEG